VTTVKLLLDNGANPFGDELDAESPLAIAASAGDVTMMRVLVRDRTIGIKDFIRKRKEAYKNLSEVFLQGYQNFIAASKDSTNFGFWALGKTFCNSNKMWKAGMKTFRLISSNGLPETVGEVVSFIVVSNAMRQYIYGTESIGLKDQFLSDLDRWKEIITDEGRPVYDEIARTLWGKDPDSRTIDSFPYGWCRNQATA